MFGKKTHGQIIGEELTEGFSHIGTAVTEAGRAAAEQLGPRVEAAREATTPALHAAQRAVVPKVAAAVAVAAPAVTSAREALVPRVEAARDALGPRVEAARDALGPRVEAAREAAAPRVASAVTAAQGAATKAAADLGPRLEAARDAAQKALDKDVVPRLGAAQAATLAYAAPKVLAARDAVSPVLENARGSLVASLGSARDELELRREEAAATTRAARKRVAKRRRKLEKRAARTATTAKRRVGIEDEPRRWPWLLVALAVGGAVFALLRRRKDDDDLWHPAPVDDSPVPSYREDPVPTSPSESGKTVSSAQTMPGDGTPPDTDLGMQPQQMADGVERTAHDDTPGTATENRGTPAGGTATAAPGDQPQTGTGALGADSDDEGTRPAT